MIPLVLYEDNHLLAIHKPPTMPSQGDESGDMNAVDWAKSFLREKYNKPGNVYVGLLHRLDRPVGGVMLLAKTSKAAGRVSKLFQSRKIEKVYHAVVHGKPRVDAGQLEHHLRQLEGKNIMRAQSKPGQNTKKATLSYRVLKQKGGLCLLEVRPSTGRKHQIRVQLAKMGCGIVGDVKYAETKFLPDKSIALLARSLSFVHPVRKEETMEITAEPPSDWPWNLFK